MSLPSVDESAQPSRKKAASPEGLVQEYSPRELIVILGTQGSFELDWLSSIEPSPDDSLAFQNELYDRYLKDPSAALLALGYAQPSLILSESLQYLRTLAFTFIKALSQNPHIEVLRDKTQVELPAETGEHLLLNAPYLSGGEYLDQGWLEHLWQTLNQAFSSAIRAYDGSVAQWFAAHNPDVHLAGRIFFHLVESKKEDYPFAFLATYSTETSPEGKSRHLPLKNALTEYGENSRKLLELLSTVHKAAAGSALIRELVHSGELFHPLGLSAEEAYTFLKEIPLYEEAGILCRMPNWWKNRTASLKMSVSIGEKAPSRLNLEALVDFKAELFLGGEAITLGELKKLLAETEGLALIKGKWVEVDRERLKETLKAYEQAQKLMGQTDLSMIEALRFQLSAQKLLKAPEETCELEVTQGQWLRDVLEKLAHPAQLEAIGCGEAFQATLRTYQEQGLSWLHYMKTLGLGACLADDMGLGKTVQIIALLNFIRSRTREKALLIVPASLIGNWKREIDTFAPTLNYSVLHPSENKKQSPPDTENLQKDLYITTYSMVHKYDWLKNLTWDTVILDEAQAIKNPGAKQTKGIKQLKASFRIALTGTPIENRLSDLWSLFDFLNKGLLGSAKEFATFTKKLPASSDGYIRLKRVVSPFILRRLKTDKSVIADLPEKIEMKTYASLSKKQVLLYNKLVKDLQAKLEKAEAGIERKGLVLSSLLKLKQICNHPDQFLGQRTYAEEESGKLARLREVCATIAEKRERVLVFTQFREMTDPLQDFLETIFRHPGLVLHGGTGVSKRQELVEKFQGSEYVPFMILSLKAGGVGLNLTAANHVIHFDRWWNPAVENQATDRAFRIGQRKNVLVHKFITEGTIEEKIDLLIEDKSKLIQDIIADGQESWITEMDNRQLMELFSLSK